MMLISENSYEDHLIAGLVALLRDLHVDAQGFLHDEAIAPVFWSAEDISLGCASIKTLSKKEIIGILEYLEADLLEAMVLAGFNVIEEYLKPTHGSAIWRHHRSLQQ